MSELYQDLLKDSSESFEDGDYFLVTIVELELEKEYPLEFRWKYKDGSFGEDWSSVKTLNSQSKTTPVAPNLDSADVEGGAGFIKVTWGGLAGGVTAVDFDRVNIYISGGSFGDGTKPAGFFKKAETRTFIAEPGLYIVVLKIQTVNGAESSASISRSVTVKPLEEQVQAPVAPTGFTSERVLGGIQVNWNGTYSGGADWYGFQAINIYAGTSATATGGTYIKVGQMTANKTTNKIVVPVDGTYVRYDTPVYIHASSVNKATPPVESSIAANVTSQALGARSAVATDLADQIITNAKLVDSAITEVKIATSAITETKIASDAITTPKIAAGAISTAKLAALAITAEKIAADAITATKIKAGEIDVTKLSAGTISVNNLESGTLSATSFIRAGTAGSSRIEISSAAVPASSILAGLYIYNAGTAVLQAPLGGGLTITGSLTATQISTSSGKFAVSTGGVLTATDVDLTGQIKATTGYIGSSNGASGWTITSSGFQSTSGSVVLNGTTGSISGASVSAATITGSTITGGLLTTGSTGARIQISGSDQGTNPNSITFTNPSGTPTSYIVPMNVGGTQYGLLMHYGSTADASGGSYPQFYLGSINAAMSSRQFAGGPSALVSVDYQLGVTLQTNSTDININGPAKFSSTMFAPNLSTSSSATNLRVTTGAVGEIQETSASSIRFKESIENLPTVGEISPTNLLNLPVRSFIYKEGYLSENDDRVQKILPGFIAEEVEEFYPIAVDYSEGQPHSWNERFIIPGMLALIQNLNQELINIKSRLDALEG